MSCPVGSNCSCGFKNTGMKYGQVWDEIHSLIDKKVGCEECNVHGHMGINGLREHIAVGIGKKPFDKQKYDAFVHEVICAHNKCKADGRC